MKEKMEVYEKKPSFLEKTRKKLRSSLISFLMRHEAYIPETDTLNEYFSKRFDALFSWLTKFIINVLFWGWLLAYPASVLFATRISFFSVTAFGVVAYSIRLFIIEYRNAWINRR